MSHTQIERSDEEIITRLWEANYDWLTTRLIENLPLKPTWRCLDVGAGGGSMSRWLAERVPQGGVLAIDTDVSLIGTDLPANLLVEQADILTSEPDQPASLDFILIRAVLSLVPDPQRLIERAISWLAPGGWLLAEDFYFMPAADSPTANGRTVVDAYVRAFQAGGANPWVGRQLPAMFARLGLTGTEMHLRPLGPGQGTSENALMRKRMELQGGGLVENGLLTADDVTEFIAAMERPDGQDVTTLQFSVWGRR